MSDAPADSRAPVPIDAGALRARVAGGMPAVRADLERLVRLASIAFDGFPSEPVEEAARTVAGLLRGTGLPEVRLIEMPAGPPAVFAHRPAPPGRPTVLLYAHYDVQPAGDETLWMSPPFEPELREGRLYGRGAADDKAGVLMHVGALRALGDELDVGVKVLVEGAEEVGLGTVEEWVATAPETVAADVIVIGDAGNARQGLPTLTTSLRGMAVVVVEIETLRGAVHSGMYGGAAPDALTALIRMLATLHDEGGSVAVKGLCANDWSGGDYAEGDFRRDAGVLDGVELIGVGTIGERLWARPAISVLGIDAPDVATATNSVVPRARAKVSARVVPGQDPAEARDALRRHLLAVAPWHVQVTVEDGAIGEGFMATTQGPAYAIAEAALHEAFGVAPVHHGQGASIPLVAALHVAVPQAEILLLGPEDPEARIHAADESVSLDELERCILAEALLLQGLARGMAT